MQPLPGVTSTREPTVFTAVVLIFRGVGESVMLSQGVPGTLKAWRGFGYNYNRAMSEAVLTRL